MIDFRFYLVTDRHVLKAASLEVAVLEACKAGARAIQLREKDLDAKSLLHVAEGLRRITASRGAALFVNDRVDIAMVVGADGVHCPEDGFPPSVARRAASARSADEPIAAAGEGSPPGGGSRPGGNSLLVGASTHSIERALEAERGGADFITFGPVFETPSKMIYGPPQGLVRLREVTRSVRLPVFAIGGVTPERAAPCVENGAWGVAVVSAVFASADIGGAVGGFERALGGL